MRAIFFDVDGVLIHGYHAKPEKRVCWDKDLERNFGITRENFIKNFINGPFVNEVLVGKRDLIDALDDVLPQIGYHGGGQNLADYWLRNDSCINFELIDKIKEIKLLEKADLYIATNQEHYRARYLMKELGFEKIFKDIFYAAQIGCLKPHPDYFQYIENVLNLLQPPIFFDDTPAVVEGACAAGWEAYLYEDTQSLLNSPYIADFFSSKR